MLELLLSAAALAQAAPGQSPRFAPPLDTPFAYVTTEERTDDGVSHRFSTERRLEFHADGSGVIAEITLGRSSGSAGGGIGGMFAAAMASLEGVPIRIHLDAAGAVLAVDDRDALWAKLCDGLAAMAPGKNAGQAQAVADAMRQLPVASRTAMLGSLASALVAIDETRLPQGRTEAVTLKTRPPSGASVILPASRQVTTTSDGLVAIRIDGEADLPASPQGRTPHIRIERHRLVDAASGLVRRSEETRKIRLDTGQSAPSSTSRTITTITPAVS